MTNINELLREANELVPRINFDDASANILHGKYFSRITFSNELSPSTVDKAIS